MSVSASGYTKPRVNPWTCSQKCWIQRITSRRSLFSTTGIVGTITCCSGTVDCYAGVLYLLVLFCFWLSINDHGLFFVNNCSVTLLLSFLQLVYPFYLLFSSCNTFLGGWVASTKCTCMCSLCIYLCTNKQRPLVKKAPEQERRSRIWNSAATGSCLWLGHGFLDRKLSY